MKANQKTVDLHIVVFTTLFKDCKNIALHFYPCSIPFLANHFLNRSRSIATFIVHISIGIRDKNAISNPMLLVTLDSGMVLYSTKFDDLVIYDSHLISCAINALTMFVSQTFQRNSIRKMRLDDIGIENIQLNSVCVTYLYTGQESWFYPLRNFVSYLEMSSLWNIIQNIEYKINDNVRREISNFAREFFFPDEVVLTN